MDVTPNVPTGRDQLARLTTALGGEPDVAGRLITEFGSIAAILAASVERLTAICGSTVAMGINAAYLANLAAAIDELPGRPLLASTIAVDRYLRLWLANLNAERVVALYLDSRHRLIRLEEMFRGTLTGAALGPREIAARALELAARSVILAHNHPSGEPSPSMADKEATRRVAQALALFEISLLDHLIISRSRTTSMRAEGYL